MKFLIIIILTLFSIGSGELFNVQGLIYERVTVLDDDGIALKTVFVPVNPTSSKSISSSSPIIVVSPTFLTDQD
jgi:hypothetical protein